MNERKANNLRLINKVQHGFFGRQGGVSPKPWDSLNVAYDLGDEVSHVKENRARICASLNVSSTALYTLKQAHTIKAVRVRKHDDQEKTRLIEADALWTTEINLAVGIETADCAPVLFSTRDGGVVGAIHAGWRGATAGIVPKTIQLVAEELRLRPQDFVVSVGPCISFDALEVGPEVIEAAQGSAPLDSVIKKGMGDRSYLDLAGLIKLQLQRLGVEQVELIRRCTLMHPDEYFSFRATKRQRGNQLSAIAKLG